MDGNEAKGCLKETPTKVWLSNSFEKSDCDVFFVRGVPLPKNLEDFPVKKSEIIPDFVAY